MTRSSNPRPRKYESAAERQAAYRARKESEGIVILTTRVERKTAETLERLAAESTLPMSEAIRQLILWALANGAGKLFGPSFNDLRYVRPLTQQAMDDRRRATKYQPMPDDDEGDEGEE